MLPSVSTGLENAAGLARLLPGISRLEHGQVLEAEGKLESELKSLQNRVIRFARGTADYAPGEGAVLPGLLFARQKFVAAALAAPAAELAAHSATAIGRAITFLPSLSQQGQGGRSRQKHSGLKCFSPIWSR